MAATASPSLKTPVATRLPSLPSRIKTPSAALQKRYSPIREHKNRRGRKKTVKIRGFACPNANCTYCGVTDDTVHALVGYGSHNGIQRFKCQACAKVFTSRVNTPLYYLKTDPK